MGRYPEHIADMINEDIQNSDFYNDGIIKTENESDIKFLGCSGYKNGICEDTGKYCDACYANSMEFMKHL